MRTGALLAAAFIALVQAPVLQADIIYLKNGKQIQCDRAWEEGKEVRYRVAQGIVGMPRSMVSKIVHTEPAQTQPATQSAPSAVQTQTAPMDAMKRLEKQAEQQPALRAQLARMYTQSGVALVSKKDLPGALEFFQKAYGMEKSPATAENLAVAYFNLKDDWNAELYFNQLLKMKPDSTTALNYLGEISWRKEDLSAAESFWEKSLAIREDPEIRQKLARLRKEKKASEAYENSTSRHFLMRYDGGTADPNLVRDISEFLENSYQQLSREFEVYPDTPFVVVLYPKQQFFRITEAPFWSAGLNDGKIKLPIKGVEAFNQDLQDVLIHELTHSFIDYKTGRNCPAWLQEGLAQYSEGRRVEVEELQALSQLLAENALPSVTRMNRSFGGASGQAAGVLYLESLSFTEFLIDRYQFYQLNQLLEELGKGTDVMQAFESVYLVPLSQIEAQWRSQFQD